MWLRDIAAGAGLVVFMAGAFALTGIIHVLLLHPHF